MSHEPQCPSVDSLNAVRINQKLIPSGADSCCSHGIHSANGQVLVFNFYLLNNLHIERKDLELSLGVGRVAMK